MLKTGVKIFSTIFPNKMVDLAYNKLSNPQVMKLRDHEIEILDKAKKEKIKIDNFDIQTYEWKGGPEKILLIHGWEGQAGNFSDIIKRLLAENFSVLSFDAPSHGFSSKGKTNFFDFSKVVGAMINRTGANKLISHSFGGVATTYALYSDLSLNIEKYVLLTTPDRFIERIDDVSAKVGITDEVKNRLLDRLASEMSLRPEQFNVSDFVKVINVKQAIIIHDKNDRVLPIQQSENVAKNWKNCNLIAIEGTGHFRILRTPIVIDQVVDFLK